MAENTKIEILLKAVGDAPILKQNKWMVDEKKTVAELSLFLRSYLKVPICCLVCAPILIMLSCISSRNQLCLKQNLTEFMVAVASVGNLDDSDSLLLFINQCFAPSPDQTVRNLKDCFAPGDSKLVINYSKTQAWG